MIDIIKKISPKTKDDNINVIIEIQKGSKNKYELDKETGLIKLDRVMYTGQDYPFDYGFIPNTLCGDGDPLDVVLYTTYPLMPGVLLEARPIGVLKMIDSGEEDDKIIAVPVEDMRLENIKDLSTAPNHFVKEVKHFMETYKILKNKIVTIDAVLDIEDARKVIDNSIEMFKK